MELVIEPPQTGGKLPIAKPAIGFAGKTGFWRYRKPVVDQLKCRYCWLCEIFCPVNVVRVEKGVGVSIDYEYCKGCGICADVCPFKAIEMVSEGV